MVLRVFLIIVVILSGSWLTTTQAQVKFPLQTSANGRYLMDANSRPFPILGRTSWCIISQPVKAYQQYIENTVSHGYNAIEMAVIFHWPTVNH
ncbi:MAG: DUF4038 domain-containing protein, partial [Sphingobacteriales bacterium]